MAIIAIISSVIIFILLALCVLRLRAIHSNYECSLYDDESVHITFELFKTFYSLGKISDSLRLGDAPHPLYYSINEFKKVKISMKSFKDYLRLYRFYKKIDREKELDWLTSEDARKNNIQLNLLKTITEDIEKEVQFAQSKVKESCDIDFTNGDEQNWTSSRLATL